MDGYYHMTYAITLSGRRVDARSVVERWGFVIGGGESGRGRRREKGGVRAEHVGFGVGDGDVGNGKDGLKYDKGLGVLLLGKG